MILLDDQEEYNMNKIKFNNTEFEVETYSKTTYFNGETITSNGSCNVVTSNVASLNSLAQNEITSIQITHDDNLIYDLNDISAKIDSINEYFTGDRMSISVSLTFDI